MELGVKDFDTHFLVNAVLHADGESKEDVGEKIDDLFVDELIYKFEDLFHCGVDFNRDDIKVKEISENTYEVTLVWSGYWTIDGLDEVDARNTASQWLVEKKPLFENMMKEICNNNSRFHFVTADSEKVTDVIEA